MYIPWSYSKFNPVNKTFDLYQNFWIVLDPAEISGDAESAEHS